MTRRYDPERLARALVELELAHAYRIMPRRFAATPLGSGPADNRFASIDAGFAVLYAADDVETALWEAVLRDRPARHAKLRIAREEIESRVLVEIRAVRTLRLIDLHGTGARLIDAPTSVVGDARHDAGRALAKAVHRTVPNADGLVYPSRFTGVRCLALFDRAAGALGSDDPVPLASVPEVRDTFERYDIELGVDVPEPPPS